MSATDLPSDAARIPRALSWRDLLDTMRPQQWPKNGLLFAGYIFAGRMRLPAAVAVREFVVVSLAFFAFCLLSSATYMINDVLDIALDRAHPEKKHRAIASGRVDQAAAWRGSALLMLMAFALSLSVVWMEGTPAFLAAAAAYVVVTLLYSFWLKHLVIVDVMVLSVGFVVRVVAGCMAIKVNISSWLILCTFTLALFMALCKRRHEVLAFGENALAVRKVLPEYTLELLNVLISLTAGASFMSYCLYTILAPHKDFMGGESSLLLLTIPLVFVGIGRYLHLAYRRDRGGKPEDLLRDRMIAMSLLMWLCLVVALSTLPRLSHIVHFVPFFSGGV